MSNRDSYFFPDDQDPRKVTLDDEGNVIPPPPDLDYHAPGIRLGHEPPMAFQDESLGKFPERLREARDALGGVVAHEQLTLDIGKEDDN